MVRESGHFTIVTNNTFKLCPWANVLYAMDNEWWRQHGKEVDKEFFGEKYSRYGNYGSLKTLAHHGHNSGAGAILLADHFGFSKVLLLGYDCQRTGGKSHWHGDHKKPLGNIQSMPHWRGQFYAVKDAISAEVINVTRETALDIWTTGRLEDELY